MLILQEQQGAGDVVLPTEARMIFIQSDLDDDGLLGEGELHQAMAGVGQLQNGARIPREEGNASGDEDGTGLLSPKGEAPSTLVLAEKTVETLGTG